MTLEFQEASLGFKLSFDQSFAYETLICVFSYLSPGDLLRASQVCRLWNWIVTDRSLWSSKIVRACGKHMRTVLEEFGERATKVGLYDLLSYDPEAHIKILKKYPNVRVLILQKCDKSLIENLDRVNNNVTEIHASEIFDNGGFIIQDFSLNFVKNMPNLKMLDVGSWFGNIVLKSLSSLKEANIEYLQASSSCIKDWKGLSEIQTLKTLVLEGSAENIECPLPELVATFKKLKNLRCLHFEMYASINKDEGCSDYSSTLLDLLRELPNITELHLKFYYNFNDQGDPNDFIKALSLCSTIKILHVSFGAGEGARSEHLFEIANSTTIFLKAVSNLKQLSKFTYNFFRMHFKIIHKYAGYDKAFTAILKPNIPLNTWNMQASKMIQLVDRQTFEALLKNALPNTQINIVVYPKITLKDNGCLACAQLPKKESQQFYKDILYGSGSDIDYSDDSSGDWESYDESTTESEYQDEEDEVENEEELENEDVDLDV